MEQQESSFLENLFISYAPDMIVYCRYLLRDNPDLLDSAEDIVQDVFLKANGHTKKLMKHKAPKAWLFLVLKRQVIDFMKKKKRQNIITISFEGHGIDIRENITSEDLVIAKQLEEQLLMSLTPAEMNLYNSYLMNDMSLNDVSKINNTSVGAEKTRLHRIRRKFLKIFSP